VISLVRVIRFPFTPYSAIYAGLYNGIHVVYGGCPVSELQNYLSLQTTSLTPVDNIFWRGIFGTDLEVLNILRVFFGAFSIILIYLGYKQISKIPVDKWQVAWAEMEWRADAKPAKA
jgi:uncharacterized membrane protein YccF (DUF307 family)